GSVSYIAIGTVIISLVRRQTTINTISMLYLLSTSVIMLLSQFLLPFKALQFLLIENYLYAQMKFLVAGESRTWMVWNLIPLLVLPIVWCCIARYFFATRATTLAQAR